MSNDEIEFDYKYVILNDNDPNAPALWEGGLDRTVDLSKEKVDPDGTIRRLDTWMTDYHSTIQENLKDTGFTFDFLQDMTLSLSRIPLHIPTSSSSPTPGVGIGVGIGVGSSSGLTRSTGLRSSRDNLMAYHLHYREYHQYQEVILGSCPTSPTDIQKLAEQENVATIMCLQTNDDCSHFDISLDQIRRACESNKIKHVQFPIRDFDNTDMSRKLPAAVKKLRKLIIELYEQAQQQSQALHAPLPKKLFLHCTAGIGRSPTVLLAYFHWVLQKPIDVALKHIKDARPSVCPNVDAITKATKEWRELNVF